MKFSTLAGTVGGGTQNPGFMGIGRNFIVSKKFSRWRRGNQENRLDDKEPERKSQGSLLKRDLLRKEYRTFLTR